MLLGAGFLNVGANGPSAEAEIQMSPPIHNEYTGAPVVALGNTSPPGLMAVDEMFGLVHAYGPVMSAAVPCA